MTMWTYQLGKLGRLILLLSLEGGRDSLGKEKK